MSEKQDKSERDRLAEHVRKMSTFKWTKKRSDAALKLAQGYTLQEVADTVGVNERTIRRWKDHPLFQAEVNRLSLMVDISGRAERLRIAMRVVRQIGYDTDRDLLDWLKYAQGETDGVKLDLTTVFEDAASMAGSG